MTTYNERFYLRLCEESVNKEDPVPEWFVQDTEGGDGSCICGKELKVLYTIKNRLNGKHLIIGSECQKKFGVECAVLCEQCEKPLSNVSNRVKENNMICPRCTRENKKEQTKLDKLGRTIMKWNGPWKGMTFSDVAKNIQWTEWFLNKDYSNKTLMDFQEYCNSIYEIDEIEVPEKKI